MQLVTTNDATSADLYIMGDIRRGNIFDTFDESGESSERKTSGLDMTKALSELPTTVGEITVHINSFGGEVAEGLAIYNALKAHPSKVTTICEGFACSIASVIFMAGDERIMRDSSLLMIHNPFLCVGGTAEDLRKAADGLDAIREASVIAYMAHATVSRDEIVSLMDAETWIPAEKAVEMGLATETESATDEDEPTQDARKAVMRALTTSDGREEIGRAIEEIALYVAELLDVQHEPSQATRDEDQDSQDDQDDDRDGDEDPETDDQDDDDLDENPRPSQRYARIFRQLAE